jgi:hypothetical protein
VLAQGNRVQIAAVVVLQIVAKQDDILAVAGWLNWKKMPACAARQRKARSVSRNWVRCSYTACAPVRVKRKSLPSSPCWRSNFHHLRHRHVLEQAGGATVLQQGQARADVEGVQGFFPAAAAALL